jgi:hypothetical protein
MRLGTFSFLILLVYFPYGCAGGSETSSRDTESVEEKPASPASSGGRMLLSAYLGLRNALVDADTLMADRAAASLRHIADSLTRDSLYTSAETARSLGNVMAETEGLIGESGLEQRRRSFVMVGEALRDFLMQSGYDAAPVYVQTCPMAFRDSEQASWLSDSREILNPYLGRHHPKYGAGMLHCGELTDSLGLSR